MTSVTGTHRPYIWSKLKAADLIQVIKSRIKVPMIRH